LYRPCLYHPLTVWTRIPHRAPIEWLYPSLLENNASVRNTTETESTKSPTNRESISNVVGDWIRGIVPYPQGLLPMSGALVNTFPHRHHSFAPTVTTLLHHHPCRGCDRTTSGRGPSLGLTCAILSEARTQSTHINIIPYIEVQVEIITTEVHILVT
jgi:hypothetical protein